ncbi:MAG: PDZ domain-containing protein [Clostridia bacterium]|nr:PDZ domain-containing protein [Clostridia bacterium]
MKTTIKRLLCLLTALVLLCSGTAFAEINNNFAAAYYDFVLENLLNHYRFEADAESIAKAVAQAALLKHPELLEELIDVTADQFDAHTEYFTQEELKDFSNYLDAEYVGIGVSVSRTKGAMMIESLFAGSPAEKAGLLAGDKILRVDGHDVTSTTLDRLVALIRGEAGTYVTLTVERAGAEMTVNVMRAAVQQNTISYDILDGNIGYLAISIFNGGTPDEMKKADAFFRANKVKKVIVDLRDNGGGELLSVVGVLGYFVPQGKTLVKIEYNDPQRNTSLRSVGDVVRNPYYRVAVLINGGTASAAELFAGNIRDHNIGKLVGSNSFGKGTMQEFLNLLNTDELPLGSIKLTTAEYILPGGSKVNGVGLKPDYWVSNRTMLLNTDDMEPMQYSAAFCEGDSGEAILALKQRFDALGYYVGEVDDQYDKELALAVKELQEKANLPATGIMDIDTQTLFSNIVSEAKVLVDDQFDRAYQLLKTGR